MLGTDSLTSMWRKSSFSASGNCVEVANQNGSVLVSDSKSHDEGRILAFPSSTWQQFIHAMHRSQ
jgi:Domain of unknown function (DUF397)